MRTTLLMLIVVLAFTGAACSGGKSKPKTAPPIAVHGTLTLNDPASVFADLISGLTNGPCHGTGGYTDVAGGAEVVISDDAGATLALAHLNTGTANIPSSGTGGTCNFTFDASVPSGKHFYGVQVTHRGVVKFSEADMAAPHVSLGS